MTGLRYHSFLFTMLMNNEGIIHRYSAIFKSIQYLLDSSLILGASGEGVASAKPTSLASSIGHEQRLVLSASLPHRSY